MAEDDPFEGIPDDPTADLDAATQQLTVRVEKRRYDKPVTVVEGFDTNSVDVDAVASRLKKKVAAGGTVNGDTIELQGDHSDRVPDLLREEGFEVT
ncbi:stress response translation initiation inhibitor YciH [Halobacterium litoreum]|uniref:Protein translation factor SUI1 homolog n=1 Tax=Halobacterium litoreum TaxID=2039234 RepID=A0ABD5NDW4_9EURY|nr:stress response translation initiation inhibitor YciH [Halobacterium litoreum]UHH13793.1 stress response translation initiation inhibitor YciH [Halobacterium litoreum]